MWLPCLLDLFLLILAHVHTSVFCPIVPVSFIIIIIIIIIIGFETKGEIIGLVDETDIYKYLGTLQSRRGVFKFTCSRTTFY